MIDQQPQRAVFGRRVRPVYGIDAGIADRTRGVDSSPRSASWHAHHQLDSPAGIWPFGQVAGAFCLARQRAVAILVEVV